MISLREILFRLQPFWRRKKIETGLSEEIQSHIAMATEANIAAGMSPREARYAALREFGGVEQIKERYRDARGVRWLEETLGDIRIAVRSLRKSPGFTTVVVLTLALCIGANSAVFSIIHAILFRPYPWPDSERLVYINNTYLLQGRERASVSIPDYLDRRSGVAAFEESALYQGLSMNLASADATPERILGMRATPSLFAVLKTRPALGRTFTDDDAKVGALKTVVLSDALWRNRFGADQKILGTEIRINDESHTVIGVMPPGFYFSVPNHQLWVPFVFTDAQKTDSGRGSEFGPMIARLKPAATIEQAQREVTAIHKANAERLPQFKAAWAASGFGGLVTGFRENFTTKIRVMLWFFQGSVAAALLIGCANVASLLLARASARERELAIRAALGAGRVRLVRHLFTESMLLFVTGGLLGLLLAAWGVSAADNLGLVRSLGPGAFGVSLDFTVFGFTLACAVVTGLAFGALPAWSATRGDTTNALKDAGARATTSRRHLSLRSTLVVTETAVALMLLATAALLIKSFLRVQEVSSGFATENVLTARFSLTAAKYVAAEKRISLHNQLLERVRALPGVISAACTNDVPFASAVVSTAGQERSGQPYEVDGQSSAAGQAQPRAVPRYASPDYFKTMGMPLLLGRDFTEHDSPTTDGVVIIDKIIADRHWPGENPIGQRLIFGTTSVPNSTRRQPRILEVIGVVPPARYANLDGPLTTGSIYLSILQTNSWFEAVVMKIAESPSQLTAALRETVYSVDPGLPIYEVKTMEGRLDEAVARRRTPMVLLALFAGIALLLATIGVYGVLAFAVGQRTQEIGVRMALGAARTNILQLILRQGVRLVALGLALGLGGYFALSTVIRKLLFSVETTDYAALLVAPATLALVALAACLIPARRATKVDPIVALRAE